MRKHVSVMSDRVFIALMILLYVPDKEKPVQYFSFPPEIEGIPADLAMAGETPDSVAVRVRAPDTTLKNLTPGRFQMKIRLSDVKPGELRIPLAGSDVRAPIGVEVLQVEPQMVVMHFERRLGREVPVGFRVKGKAASGFEYAGYTIVPERVKVEGPEGVVSDVKEVFADEVDITGRSLNFETPVGLTPDRGGVRIVNGTGVVVRVAIRPARITRV